MSPRVDKSIADEAVHIPDAVRRAAAAADAAIAAANPQPAPQPAPAETITITPVAPRLPQQVSPLQIESAPAPAPQPEPRPQPEDENNATWKNRYEAMLGRFRDTSSQLQQANSRMEAMENMLANMSSAPPAPAPTAPTETPRFLTKKDEEEMGPEMIDFVRRAAQEVVAPLTSLQQELATLKTQVQATGQNVAVDARARMHADLNRDLPNWNAINHDEDFHAWLALQDGFSGATRKKLLTQAYAQNDTARVLAIFKGFVSETGGPASLPTVQAPAPVAADPRPTLEDLAAPGRARTAASPQAPAEKQIIRTSDINAFYAAVRRGAYKGREELQRQHEAELSSAMQEGRIMRDT